MSTSDDTIQPLGPRRSNAADIPYHPSDEMEFLSVPRTIDPSLIEYIEPAMLAHDPQLAQHMLFFPSMRSPYSNAVRNGNSGNGKFRARFSGLGLSRDAADAAREEARMSILEALPIYRKGILWSALLSLTLVMEGFDITLIYSFFAFPAFRKDFGDNRHGHVIPAPWQAALNNGALGGEIVGLFINGLITERIGNRKTMLCALIVLTGAVFLAFFGTSREMMLVSQVLCGLPWGIFQTLSTSYAAEVVPIALRAYLTSSINICWLMGQFSSAAILRGLFYQPSPWAYRIPLAAQWGWIVILFTAGMFVPESPWWLIQHDKPEAARRAFLRIANCGPHPDFQRLKLDRLIALMQYTNEREKAIHSGTSYSCCFKGTNLRRTEICCMTWMTQAVCGSMASYAAYFYRQVGALAQQAFTLNVAMYSAGILGVFLCWAMMRKAGRRTLYLWGCALIAAVLAAIGTIAIVTKDSPWVLGFLIILLKFVYDSTVGPVCYSLVSEIPCTRLRMKTVVIARVSYNLVNIVINVINAKALTPTAWNWGGRTCLLWACVAVVCYVWCWFRLPEPKGLTFLELDRLFEKKASARQFGKVRKRLAAYGYLEMS